SAVAVAPTTLAVITHDYLQERINHADPMLRHLLRVTTARHRQAMRGASGATPAPACVEAPAADRDVALRRLRMEQDIERACEREEFELHYQPIVRVADTSVAGFESLLRWNKPGQGRVSPGEFIPVAEESGLIRIIGRWIIDTAFAGIQRLEAVQRAAAPSTPPLFVTVNLSTRQMGDAALFDTLAASLAKHALAPQRVKLEITESMVMENMQTALELLHRCKALGTLLAVDDFGTGHSSLSYLHKFPMDTLKLDRSFLTDLPTSEASRKIVRAVVNLAAELGMDSVFEGVEDAQQVQACREVGITYIQGYYYGKPMPLAAAAEFLSRHAAAPPKAA
ncbi:MAG TPA: EAL domain-containing protein, partial [Nevskiaceae bacterium]|nr:EAL domain-containing protein [Nevskiaceae bacterium]